MPVPASRPRDGWAEVSDDPLLGLGQPGGAARRLLEAAADAFAAKGFHATTTRDIASRAGMSPAGVYVHFPTKEALLFALSESGHTVARDLLQATVAQAATPAEALASIMATFSSWHAHHYRIGHIVQHEFAHLSPEHREVVLGLRKDIDEVFREVLRQGVADGEFAVEEVEATALALTSLCVDVARWYAPEIRRTPAQIGRTNARLGMRLVAAPPRTGT